jgi:hypothetical protein
VTVDQNCPARAKASDYYERPDGAEKAFCYLGRGKENVKVSSFILVGASHWAAYSRRDEPMQ